MNINQNNDISVYRGETAAIDFKMSQRSEYYVPFLISSARVNPMVCITIGSTRRENKNIVTKQLWLEVANVPKFNQTVVEDLATISAETEAALVTLMETGIMYQFKREAEVAAGNPKLHFAYIRDAVVEIDEYHFTITMAVDETITLDMINTDYFYQIELMDTEPMIPHLQNIFSADPTLLTKLPDGFVNTDEGITEYLNDCIKLITKTYPNHWGHRINDPLTSPVASVSAIQILQPPRRFTVISVIK